MHIRLYTSASGRFASIVIAAMSVAGCSTVSTTSVTGFSTAVAAAQTQTEGVFDDVVTLTRASAVDDVARQPTLTENRFVTVPGAEARRAWDSVLTALQKYASDLSKLASGEVTGTDTAIGSLAKELNTTSADLKSQLNFGKGTQVAAGPVAAVAGLADALEQAKADKEVTKVAAQTDLSVHNLADALANGIGASASDGLRGTVRANWSQQLMELQTQFLHAGTPDKRAPIVQEYVAILTKRDTEDEALVSLRASYLALADAHAAIVQGNQSGLESGLAFIQSQIQHEQQLRSQLAEILPH